MTRLVWRKEKRQQRCLRGKLKTVQEKVPRAQGKQVRVGRQRGRRFLERLAKLSARQHLVVQIGSLHLLLQWRPKAAQRVWSRKLPAVNHKRVANKREYQEQKQEQKTSLSDLSSLTTAALKRQKLPVHQGPN